jgi:hypothetical protein
VLTFHDNEEEFARCYEGLINFQEGDIITLIRTSKEMPVSPGNYVIRRRHIPNALSFALDDESKPDQILRQYDLEKLD